MPTTLLGLLVQYGARSRDGEGGGLFYDVHTVILLANLSRSMSVYPTVPLFHTAGPAYEPRRSPSDTF
jgi:hypothetical protein